MSSHAPTTTRLLQWIIKKDWHWILIGCGTMYLGVRMYRNWVRQQEAISDFKVMAAAERKNAGTGHSHPAVFMHEHHRCMALLDRHALPSIAEKGDRAFRNACKNIDNRLLWLDNVSLFRVCLFLTPSDMARLMRVSRILACLRVHIVEHPHVWRRFFGPFWAQSTSPLFSLGKQPNIEAPCHRSRRGCRHYYRRAVNDIAPCQDWKLAYRFIRESMSLRKAFFHPMNTYRFVAESLARTFTAQQSILTTAVDVGVTLLGDVTINRPRQIAFIGSQGHVEYKRLKRLFEDHPSSPHVPHPSLLSFSLSNFAIPCVLTADFPISAMLRTFYLPTGDNNTIAATAAAGVAECRVDVAYFEALVQSSERPKAWKCADTGNVAHAAAEEAQGQAHVVIGFRTDSKLSRSGSDNPAQVLSWSSLGILTWLDVIPRDLGDMAANNNENDDADAEVIHNSGFTLRAVIAENAQFDAGDTVGCALVDVTMVIRNGLNGDSDDSDSDIDVTDVCIDVDVDVDDAKGAEITKHIRFAVMSMNGRVLSSQLLPTAFDLTEIRVMIEYRSPSTCVQLNMGQSAFCQSHPEFMAYVQRLITDS